jgi:hypothetical protein
MDGTRTFSTISKCLQPGERVIWQDVPDPWIAARQYAYPLIFMTVWTGGVSFGIWNIALKPNAPAFSVIVLCLFAGFGAFSWFRTLQALTACWTTVYALTDRRIIIAAGEANIQSFNAAALGDISRTGSGARGSLIFGSGTLQTAYRRRSRGFLADSGLYGIAEPARVEALIYKTLIMPQKEGKAI